MCILNKELFLFYFYFLLLINIASGHKHVDKLQQKKQYVCSNKQDGKTYSEKILKKTLKLKNKIRKDLSLSDEDFIGIISEVEQYEQYLIYKEHEMKRSKKKLWNPMEQHSRF